MTRPPPREEESGLQLVLAAFGVPTLVGKEGNRTPWATWLIALALVAVFLLGLLEPQTFGADRLAFRSDAPSVWSACTATFAHFGWLHLFGNLGFLVAFGSGLEQKLPRAGHLLFFVVAGALTIWVDALAGGDGRLIGGASGAVSALMGACVVLQPRARVLVVLLRFPLQVPVLVFGLCELGFQLLMWRLALPGVAWIAHATGIVLGLLVALAIHVSRRAVPDDDTVPRAPQLPTPPRTGSSRSPWR